MLVAIGGEEYNSILRQDYPKPAQIETWADVDNATVNALLDLVELCD